MHPVPQDLIDQLVVPDGGFTWQPRTGEVPTKGFAVSIHKGRERQVYTTAWEHEGPQLLADFVAWNADLLVDDNAFVGAWRDPASLAIYLDISCVCFDEEKARLLARMYGQIAYYDFAAGKSVPVDKILAA